MNFLLISQQGEALDIAYKLKLEKHNSYMCILDKKVKDVGDGIVEKVDNYRSAITQKKIDLVWIDGNHNYILKEIKQIKKNILTFGGSALFDKAELDREFGQLLFYHSNFKIIPFKRFNNTREAIEFIKKYPNRYVIKPDKNIAAQFTFVGEDKYGRDVIKKLQNIKSELKQKEKQEFRFILQQYVEGIEVGITCYFNGIDFVQPYNLLFEHKKLFSGNYGVQTGEMGSLVVYPKSMKLFNKTLLKLKPYLQMSNYKGIINIGTIITETTIYPLEFGSRIGYPEIYAQDEAQYTPWSEIMYAIATGKQIDIKIKHPFSIVVCVASEGFPFAEEIKRYSVGDEVTFPYEVKNHIHYLDVKVKDSRLVVTEGGMPLTVTYSAPSVSECREKVYEIIKQIQLENKEVRDDIGERWFKEAPILRKWGYFDNV